MKNYLFGIIFLLAFFNCEKKNSKTEIVQNAKQELPTFEVYGGLPPVGVIDGYDEKEKILTKKYGFVMKRVADCDVTDELVKKAIKNNKKAMEEMNRKYGKDWVAKFERETGFQLAIQLE